MEQLYVNLKLAFAFLFCCSLFTCANRNIDISVHLLRPKPVKNREASRHARTHARSGGEAGRQAASHTTKYTTHVQNRGNRQ